MPLTALSLEINTPTEPTPFGRGFYQLEEEVLYLPLEYPNRKGRFFSYLESDTLTFHTDRAGRLIFIEVDLPRRRWEYSVDLICPETAEPADIRFLDFRVLFAKPEIYCDKTRELLMFRFTPGPAVENYYLAKNLICQVDGNSRLVAIWAFDLSDDIAGQEIAAWRGSIHDKSNSLSPTQVSFHKKGLS